MLTLNQKIRKWSRAVNRNKTFTPIEMEEMEDHLLVEIKQMVEFDHLSEEVAFQKATKSLGEQGILDEEYGKVRWSAFFKVKLWAYLQTFVILGLVLFLVVPYIHFPVNNNNGFVIGQEIGEIGRWAYDASKNSPDSYVTHQNEVWFYNQEQKNIYSYQYRSRDISSVSVFLNNIYFDTSSFTTYLGPFDIDYKKDLYVLFFEEKMVNVYRDKVFIKQYTLPEEISTKRLQTIKVVNNNLILLCTETKTKKAENEEYLEEVDVNSSLYVLDLSSKQITWNEKKLRNIVLSQDRSEDEIATLYIDGSIEIYTVLKNNLKLLEERRIVDFPKLVSDYSEKKFNLEPLQGIKKMKTTPRLWKFGWLNMEDYDSSKKPNVNPIKSFFKDLVTKIKSWEIVMKKPKPANFIAKKVHYIDKKDIQSKFWFNRPGINIPDITWFGTETRSKGWWVKPYDETWNAFVDDDGQIWFNPISFYRVNHTFSNCHISLLFSKKNHQLVLVENNNRFSYLVLKGKELQILPLTDKNIEGVMKINFIGTERLAIINNPYFPSRQDSLTLHLIP